MFRVLENVFSRKKPRWQGRKGQSMVEFAIIFPFFLFIVYSVIYAGFVFADYLTLTNLARSTAREASLSVDTDEKHQEIITSQLQALGNMPSANNISDSLFLFVKDGTLEGDATFTIDAKDSNVIVTIEAPMNDKAFVGKMFQTFGRWGNSDATDYRKKSLNVQYTMYNETNKTSS